MSVSRGLPCDSGGDGADVFRKDYLAEGAVGAGGVRGEA